MTGMFIYKSTAITRQSVLMFQDFKAVVFKLFRERAYLEHFNLSRSTVKSRKRKCTVIYTHYFEKEITVFPIFFNN